MLGVIAEILKCQMRTRRWRWWRNTTLRISTKNGRAPWFLTCKKPSKTLKAFLRWSRTNANVRLYHRINSRKELIELFEQIPRFRTKEMTKNQVIWEYLLLYTYLCYCMLYTYIWSVFVQCHGVKFVFAQCCHVVVNKVEATLDAEKEASRVWRKETEVTWIGIVMILIVMMMGRGIVERYLWLWLWGILDHHQGDRDREGDCSEVYNISGFNLYANYL